MSLRRFLLAAGLALSTSPFAGAAPAAAAGPTLATPAQPLPRHEGIAPQDAAFDVRLDLLRTEKGQHAAFVYAEKEFARDPRPHVEARYAEFLLEGEAWGAPAGQTDRGLQLAQHARGQGDLYALAVLGWQVAHRRFLPGSPELAPFFLEQASKAGNSDAMLMLGEVYLQGIGTAVNLTAAERWFTRAAWQGKTQSLFRLGRVYESLSPPDPAKAAALYYEAAERGNGPARKRLEELTAAGDPAGTRAYHLYVVTFVMHGGDYATKKVRTAVAALESGYPDDPAVIVPLGRLYETNRYVSLDTAKARRFFEHAMELGSADAKAEHARLFAEGWGVKKDPARAVATWRELAAAGNARAAALLGFYSYWGTLGSQFLPKDATKAFEYSVRAAEAGDAVGQVNTAAAYEFGIGTPIDYALAASYYRAAAWRGDRRANEQLPKLLRAALR